ncbi:MAG: hypothetical protein ACOCZR_00825 [Halanaerobiales bacterium]
MLSVNITCDVCERELIPGEEFFVIEGLDNDYYVCNDIDCKMDFFEEFGRKETVMTKEEIEAAKGDMRYHAMVDEYHVMVEEVRKDD